MNNIEFFNKLLPKLVGQVYQIIDQSKATCRCPGADQHSTPTARNHTTAFWNEGKPRIHCYHQSCQDAVKAVNMRLMVACPSSWPRPTRAAATPTDKTAELEAHAKKSLPYILNKYHWPYWQIVSDSPYHIADTPEVQTLLHLALFDPYDVIWIGNVRDTGKRWHKVRFKRRDDWLRWPLTGNFICPSIFAEGCWSRSEGNVRDRRYLVVESDQLGKDEVGAIFRFLMEKLTLRAVVDTGNRSLHGWFDYPADGLGQLEFILPGFGCDDSMFKAAQPARLAGRKRDNGRWQRLIFLNPEVSHES